jgi:hypothetical protein
MGSTPAAAAIGTEFVADGAGVLEESPPHPNCAARLKRNKENANCLIGVARERWAREEDPKV